MECEQQEEEMGEKTNEKKKNDMIYPKTICRFANVVTACNAERVEFNGVGT